MTKTIEFGTCEHNNDLHVRAVWCVGWTVSVEMGTYEPNRLDGACPGLPECAIKVRVV